VLTGATGYVGGRLAPRLLERGYCVRVLARDASRLAARPWREQVEVIEGDVGDADAVRRALQGVEVAYYLVHSMQSGADFAARDRRNAEVFADAARAAGVRHVVYLGGLLPKGRRAQPAPEQPRRSRANPARENALHGAARGSHHWLWLRLVRDGALPNRAATDYDYPALD
jgi:uncharacterized protein YbjT (DUF2867 family)